MADEGCSSTRPSELRLSGRLQVCADEVRVGDLVHVGPGAGDFARVICVLEPEGDQPRSLELARWWDVTDDQVVEVTRSRSVPVFGVEVEY